MASRRDLYHSRNQTKSPPRFLLSFPFPVDGRELGNGLKAGVSDDALGMVLDSQVLAIPEQWSAPSCPTSGFTLSVGNDEQR